VSPSSSSCGHAGGGRSDSGGVHTEHTGHTGHTGFTERTEHDGSAPHIDEDGAVGAGVDVRLSGRVSVAAADGSAVVTGKVAVLLARLALASGGAGGTGGSGRAGIAGGTGAGGAGRAGAQGRAGTGRVTAGSTSAVAVLSRDRLLAEVWPAGSGDPGPLRVAVGRARAVFGPGVIVTVGSGYGIGPHTSDVGRFEALVAAGRDVGRPVGERVVAFERALAEWSGPVLEDVDAGVWVWAERARLGEARERVVEERFELMLAAGGHQRVVSEVAAAAVAAPAREHRVWLLAVALYRCGRQAEALSTLAVWGRRLRAEFGLEPGPALRELEQRILHHDPVLDVVVVECGSCRARTVGAWRGISSVA
jgi:DNA-binding SARP family transcriptional activator